MWFIQFQLNVFDKAVDGIGVKKRLLTLGNDQNLGKGRMSLVSFFPQTKGRIMIHLPLCEY